MVGHGHLRVGLRAGRVWCAHRDDEALSGNRHRPPARWDCWRDAARSAGTGRRTPAGRADPWFALRGVESARPADRTVRARRLGQRQLCGARLHRFPHLPRLVVAADGLRARVCGEARARPGARRGLPALCRADRDPLRASAGRLRRAAGDGSACPAARALWRGWAAPVRAGARGPGAVAAGKRLVQCRARLADRRCAGAHRRRRSCRRTAYRPARARRRAAICRGPGSTTR